jgi:regulatory protein YycH of two-component signal transduction system YycFG
MDTKTVRNEKMSKPLIQIDDQIREMNATELAEYQSIVDETLKEQNQKKAKAIEKIALLERLGLTADEAALLVQ